MTATTTPGRFTTLPDGQTLASTGPVFGITLGLPEFGQAVHEGARSLP